MEDRAFVTEDKWMIESGGVLDCTDQQLLREASQGGRFYVRIINIKGMLESMRDEDPGKFQELKKEMENHAGSLIPLSFDELVELSRKGNERLDEFEGIVAPMNLGQAAQVRHWRVDNHMTWRSVSRAAYEEGFFLSDWDPPSNQLMGMALCNKAAQVFDENYREEPWN